MMVLVVLMMLMLLLRLLLLLIVWLLWRECWLAVGPNGEASTDARKASYALCTRRGGSRTQGRSAWVVNRAVGFCHSMLVMVVEARRYCRFCDIEVS